MNNSDTVTTMEMEMHVQMIHEFLGYNNTGSNDNSSNDTSNESNNGGNNEQEQDQEEDQDDQIDLLVDQEEDHDDQIQIDLLVNELPTLNACILFLKLTEYICYHSESESHNNVQSNTAIRSGVKPNVIRKSIELWREKNNSDTTGRAISIEQELMINELICNAVKRTSSSDESESSNDGTSKNSFNNNNVIEQIAMAMNDNSSSTTTSTTTSTSTTSSLKHPVDVDNAITADTTDIENEIKIAIQKLIQKLVKELDYELNIPQKDDERLIQNFHNTICLGRSNKK